MTDLEKRKLIARAKIGFGAARMASGIATGCGVGIVGTALRQRHMMELARRIAVVSIKGGKAMFDEGQAELKRCR